MDVLPLPMKPMRTILLRMRGHSCPNLGALPKAFGIASRGGPRSNAAPMSSTAPLVAVIMGSTSDWETLRHAAEMLEKFGVAHERRVVSAHRTPVLMAEFAQDAAGR